MKSKISCRRCHPINIVDSSFGVNVIQMTVSDSKAFIIHRMYNYAMLLSGVFFFGKTLIAFAFAEVCIFFTKASVKMVTIEAE